MLDKVKKQLQTAGNTIDETNVRTRAIERKLKEVECLPEGEACAVLEISEGFEQENTGRHPAAARRSSRRPRELASSALKAGTSHQAARRALTNRSRQEFATTASDESAMAIAAQTGESRPIAASGTVTRL